jgi:nucleoid DNA-binding protein
MQTITNLTQEVNKKSKTNNLETTRKILTTFLEVTKQKLLQGEPISFQGYFALKRSTTPPKGSKYCHKHEKSFTDYKKTNKGKGLAAFTKSPKFRNLVNDTKKCKDCQKQKQTLLKSLKPLNRLSFKVSKSF